MVPTPANLRMNRALRRLDRVMSGLIERRRAGSAGRDDLLTLMLHARNEEAGRMTDRHVRGEGMTLLLAGHETTASVRRASRPPRLRLRLLLLQVVLIQLAEIPINPLFHALLLLRVTLDLPRMGGVERLHQGGL